MIECRTLEHNIAKTRDKTTQFNITDVILGWTLLYFLLPHLFLSISLNLSSSTMLVDSFPKELKSATISFLESLRSSVTGGSPGRSNSPEKRILRAVPRPVTWSLPQSLHLSQPTQSITLVIFLKCSLNSTFSSCKSKSLNISSEERPGVT